jgi:histidinol-phosphatase (PHP family)
MEVLIGFETERLPEPGWAERMRGFRTAGDFEYMIGSVHHVGARWIDFSPQETARAAEEHGGLEALQLRYFRDLAELAGTLRPEVIGHLDLIRKFDGAQAGFSPRVMREVERTLEAVRAAGSVLDINPGAHRRGLSPVYPLPAILERACAMGIGVTLGDDSHGPDTVGNGLDVCMRAIAAAGYTRVCYFARSDGRLALQSAPLEEVMPRSRSDSA